MHPVLFQLGSFQVYTYGVVVGLAFLLGTLWITYRANAQGQDAEQYLALMFWLMLGSVVGARLWHVFYALPYYAAHPWQVVLDRGGLVWYGGVLGAFVTVVIFSRIYRLPVLQIGDMISPPAVLGLAFGRVGCFATGCCYGKATTLPWGVCYPAGHTAYPAMVHPVQLYESACMLLLMSGLLLLERQFSGRVVGLVMGAFFMGMGCIRFVMEMLRGDTIVPLGFGLSVAQIVSLFAVGLGLCLVVKTTMQFQESTLPKKL